MSTLVAQHDCLLLDLDGTLFRGAEPTVGAVDTLASSEVRALYITNNASRSATEVAAHLCELGFDARPDDVVTSAHTAAHVLAAELAADSAVLVVGTDALAAEVAAVGLRPVRTFGDAPVAVVQGHSAQTGWADLAEAALAIRAGALWVAANTDVTLPSERGLLPGNGAMVAALRAATDQQPRVAGKPHPGLFADALSRGSFHAPLVVGDRLDTDIAGANAAGLPSLMVLTGVNTAEDAVFAEPAARPTYLSYDLRALTEPSRRLAVTNQPQWQVDVTSEGITVTAAGSDTDTDHDAADDGLAVVRAVADAVWRSHETHRVPLRPGDERARAALRRAVESGAVRSATVNTS